MMKKTCASLILIAVSPSICAGALKDPRKRDDDISATGVAVEVKNVYGHFFEYIYTLTAPEINKTTISSFSVDIACADPAPEVVFPEPPTTYPWDYRSGDGRHSPFQPYPSPTGSAWMMFGLRNWLSFLMTTDPGERHTGFRILSPYPPMSRPYKLEITWKTGEYSYENLTNEEMSALPIRDEFYVYGMTQGPGCSPDALPGQLFPGTGEEPDDDLMMFEAPLRSAFHTVEETVRFRIHYANDIDPKSFTVFPESARGLFNPAPGKSEEVFFKLEPGINKLTLSVDRDIPTTEAAKLVFLPFDRDAFVFRREQKDMAQEMK